MANPLRKLTGNGPKIKEFIDKFDTFLFDCDGVLWSGDHLFEGTVEALEWLRKEGKQIVFVTNNSTKSREDYRKKLESLGIPASVDEVFGSSYSASIYISRILKLPKDKKVFIIGESGLEHELASEGISYICGTNPAYRRPITPDDYKTIASGAALDPDVAIVLAGLDFQINYLKLSFALHYLRKPGVKYLATNTDLTLPSANSLFPGAGAISAPLTAMFRSLNPDHPGPLQLGKPSQAMMDAIEGKYKLDRERTCMVGDRLDTDIKFGIEGGLGGTLAVLTGVGTEEEFIMASKEGTGPGVLLDRLADLLAARG